LLASAAVGCARQNSLPSPIGDPAPATINDAPRQNFNNLQSNDRLPPTSIASLPPASTIRGNQIPIAQTAPLQCPPAVSSLGGFPTPAAGEHRNAARGRHPKTFTTMEVE
jgi:hypothetical protein